MGYDASNSYFEDIEGECISVSLLEIRLDKIIAVSEERPDSDDSSQWPLED